MLRQITTLPVQLSKLAWQMPCHRWRRWYLDLEITATGTKASTEKTVGCFLLATSTAVIQHASRSLILHQVNATNGQTRQNSVGLVSQHAFPHRVARLQALSNCLPFPVIPRGVMHYLRHAYASVLIVYKQQKTPPRHSPVTGQQRAHNPPSVRTMSSYRGMDASL